MLHRKKGEKKKKVLVSGSNEKERERQEDESQDILDLITPDGINPNPLGYMVIDDGGQPLYTMCMYAQSLPSNATFANTFATLFNYPGVTSNVFVNPMTKDKSSKKLDKRVNKLDSERIVASERRELNRCRKMNSKIAEANQLADEVESGDNQLYEVGFLFTIQDVRLDSLMMKVNDFHNLAKEKIIELSACYAVHPESFISGYPLNKVYKANLGVLSTNTIKTFEFDKDALCTIFNHTRSSFYHPNGVVIGRSITTGQPVTYDVYDTTHDNYGVAVAGASGKGKSSTVKIINSRAANVCDYYIRSIDYDARGRKGEYALMTKELGGISYQIAHHSDQILNIFEVEEEDEFDEVTSKEYTVLNLKLKKSNLRYLLMVMIKDGEKIEKFQLKTYFKKILESALDRLYEERGIYDGDVDSLYQNDVKGIFDGKVRSGKVKKEMPTFSDFYKILLLAQKKNENRFYEEPFELILSALAKYVKELYYCPKCMKFYSKEEYMALKGECHNKEIVAIKGSRPYFDGVSTAHASVDTRAINIDISQLPKDEKEVALLIAMNYMEETYLKKNSINPLKAKKMVFLIDELHKTFHIEEARKFIESCYRTLRKRKVSPWSITQSLADYSGYKETETILKNASTIMIFRHDTMDKEFFLKNTQLTESQVKEILTLGGNSDDPEEAERRKGEMCMIDNGKVVFVKIDYIKSTEAWYVETDINKIREMHEKAVAN